MIQENSGVGHGIVITCLRRGSLAIHDTCSVQAVYYGQAITKEMQTIYKDNISEAEGNPRNFSF